MSEAPSRPTAADLVSLADEERAAALIRQSVLGLWEVVKTLTRLRPSQRPEFRVTIFGSARIPAEHWVYATVRDLAAELARLGCTIITGGGPGLMRAANEGAAAAGHSVGVRIDLPFEQETNPFVGEVFEHGTFFTRLHHFVLVSDAFVIVPGGIGTVLELAMIWQLLQVRQLHDTPLILIGTMWAELVDWVRRYLLGGELALASPADLDIPRCVATADEALALIRERHARWQAAASAVRA